MHNTAIATALITGGAGFFGSIFTQYLLEKGWDVVSIDLQKHEVAHPKLTAIQGDIRNAQLLDELFTKHKPEVIFHFASILAHAVKDKNFLWSSNVDGTRTLAEAVKKHGVKKVIFTSSNCLWGNDMGRLVREDDEPAPVEIYGKSKWEGEKILLSYKDSFDTVIFHCPTIMDGGRLGLLSILFEFIDEGRKVWVVDGGRNRYQFIYAKDLADACLRAATQQAAGIFNIGSDNVKTFREVYQDVIAKAGTGARVANLPGWFVIPMMKLAYHLGLSPLGPYQYKMIAADFCFDTAKIKSTLGWKPTTTNEQMLWEAYRYYHDHRKEIEGRTDASDHRKSAKMGVIRLLKWVS